MPTPGALTGITSGSAGAVQSHAYTYDLLGKLLTRSDANTALSESFVYDTLNRLTSATVSAVADAAGQDLRLQRHRQPDRQVRRRHLHLSGRRAAQAACRHQHQRRHDQHHLHLRRQGQHDRRQRPHRRLRLLQQADLHHPRHHHHRLQPRPRAPALPADRARRHHALSRATPRSSPAPAAPCAGPTT